MSNENAQEFEERDDHIVQSVVSKCEERKLITQNEFETVCSKFWNLIMKNKQGDDNLVSREQYCELLTRIYRFLAPLYREAEMKSQVAQEWFYDSHGQEMMDQNLFSKFIFRIAHQWSTSIDLKEYVELLDKIYSRIVIRKIVRYSGKVDTAYPTIQVTIDQEKQPQNEEFGDAEWESCAEDESEDDGYSYDIRDGKRWKQAKKDTDFGATDPTAVKDVFLTARDPFYFKEVVQYYLPNSQGIIECQPPTNEDFEYDALADHKDIFPLGYPTEQYLAWVKNDTHKAIQELKMNKKKTIQAMKRDLFNGGNDQQQKAAPNPSLERERGLIEENGRYVTQYFQMYRTLDAIRILTKANMHDATYNSLRGLFKDNSALQIRPHFAFPTRAGSAERGVDLSQPLRRFSAFGFNPTLERRINYVYTTCKLPNDKEVQMWVNVNYLIMDPVYETAYRSDVQRVESSNKMAIKPNEEFTRDEDFNNVTTSFRDAVQVMLQKKYESFFTIKLQGDTEVAVERDEKIFELERNRRKLTRINELLTSKGLFETFDAKDFLKVIKGPFYKLQSKSGPTEDDFGKCATSDLIDIANKEIMRVLIVAKPRCGKTTLAKQLEKRLNLVRVAADQWIDNLFKKIKDREENPPEEEPVPELEEGQEPPPKKSWLQPLEESVVNKLKTGGAPSDEEINTMLKEMIASPEAQTRGFVIDLDYAFQDDSPKSWVIRFKDFDIMGDQQLTHIVELTEDSQETKARAASLFQTPTDGIVYSKWQRDLRANRKKPVDEEGNEIEEDEETVAANRPFTRLDLVKRVCDNDENVINEIQQYDSPERPDIDDWIIKMHASTFIKLPAAGLTPDEIAESIVYRLKPNKTEPNTPFAKMIEGGGDFASLLSQDVNIDEGQLPRQYSLWRTTDPVSLSRGKVVAGLPEFAAHFANNVFVFENESNMKTFLMSPRNFLSSTPSMPADYRILILGPRGAGVRTQARLLNQKYGWRLVDFNLIVRNKLQEILALPIKPPNNLTTVGPCMVCLSQEELQEIKDGKPFPAWKFLPWVLEFLGVPLMVKPPEVKVVVEPNPDEMNDEEKKAYEKLKIKKAEEKKKKDKEEADAKVAKEDRARRRAEALENGQDLNELGLQESEEEIKIDDLPIDQLIVKKDEDGNLPKIGQIILFGFPQTELHITKLKEYGLVFDKIIYLNDTTEEDPGREIKKRMAGSEFVFDWDEENAKAQKVLANCKEFIGEDTIVEVDCTGKKENVLIKIQTKIDPFFMQADSEEVKFDWSSLPTADEENPRRGPKSDFGDYCPVTYVNSGFLVKGKSDFESFVFGKSYRFAGEKEQEEFKFNPTAFLSKVTIPLTPPQPKIMVIGMKGAGVTTQISLLAKKFKIDSLELKSAFLSLMKSEKQKRKRARLLARGFKEPAPVEDEEAEPEPDAEIEDDPAEFVETINQHYSELMHKIIDSKKPLVIDGHWTTMPEDLEISLGDTLIEARRTPEVIVILRCKEASTFKRCIDNEAIKKEYEADCKKRNDEINKKREEDKLEKLKELAEENKQDPEAEEKKPQDEIDKIISEAIQAWEQERIEADKQALEDDPVKDEKTRREEIEEALRAQLEKDTAFLDDLAEKMKENGVEVVDGMNTDISAEYVHIKLLDKIKARIQHRADLIEREQAQILKLSEVKFYEESYTYKHSKFGLTSPITQFNPYKTKEFAVLYRERIYFLNSKAEQDKFLLEPSKYTINCLPCPQDLVVRPTAVVIGLPSSGKSTLASIISKKTGLVHLQPEEIIESFIKRDSVFSERLRKKTQIMGDEVDDTTFIEMLQSRILQQDCSEKGWILDGYPQTRAQAVQMATMGIVPENVFQITVPVEVVYNRTAGYVQSEFDCDRTILVRRLTKQATSIPETGFFYNKYYNNVISVNGQKSRWYMEDLALESIEKTIKAKLEFSRDNFSGSVPCKMEKLNCDRIYMKQSISQYGYMCPVSWKVYKKFVNCTHRPENCVLYKNLFYYFASRAERDIFLADPSKFTFKINFSHERNIPKRYRSHKAAEIISQEKALLGHCPVTLKDEERVEKGYQISVISFKDNRFVFASEEKASRFFLNPSRYHEVQLPVKMPPPKDNVLLYQLQKQDDSITFMEQALGQVVTRALREVGENRLKYPTLSVKETMLKLFAIFLKAENPANTEYMRQKYRQKMKQFIYRCEVPQELHELSIEKKEKLKKDNLWPQFKEDYYNKLGSEFDDILKNVPKEIATGFSSYMK